MTGFGTARIVERERLFVCEVRSVNHKYCDIRLRLPKELLAFESRAQNLIRARVARGRIDLSIELHAAPGAVPKPEVDEPLAAAYFSGISAVATRLGLAEGPSIDLIAGLPGVVRAPDRSLELEAYESALEGAVKSALDELDGMRAREGAALSAELARLLESIEAEVDGITRETPVANRQRRDRLEERLRELLEGSSADPIRVAQEVAILVDRSDVTEEIARLRSHVEQSRRLLAAPEPVGRKLDFLLQEMHREANTIGSKSGSAVLSHMVVDLKSALERMREQVQNVE